MPKFTPALSPNEPDPALLDLHGRCGRVGLAAVEAVALLSLSGFLVPAVGRFLESSGHLMNPLDALCAVVAAVGLQLSAPNHGLRSRLAGFLLACLVLLLGGSTFAARFIQIYLGIRRAALQASYPLPAQSIDVFIALAFALLGVTLLLIQTQRRIAVRVADILLIVLGFLAVVLVSGYLFHFLEDPRPLPRDIAPETLFCIALLSLVAFLRHEQSGIFAVFLGRGIAGSIARFAAPILMFLPFVREGFRIFFLGTGPIPPSFFSAVLASIASFFSMCLLLYIAWRISKMESEIHALSLRDELTDLANLRGFRLLAEQALRMSRRAHVPFSLLFIDLDRLKDINDTFGHAVGSNILSDTGKILHATFRESDIVGRVGGDEFAVAGQFSRAAITVAVHRLHEAIAQRNAHYAKEPYLSLSLGHVTCDPDATDTLDELLAKADFAMYEDKRHNKSRTA